MRNYLFILLFLFLHITNSFCQNPFVTNYSVTDGLPTSKIYCVEKDSRGFMWFGTDKGVIRYDGLNFLVISEDDGLSYNMVIRIKEDMEGRLWFLNLDGSVNFYFNNKIHNEVTDPFLKDVRTTFMYHDFLQTSDSTIYFYNVNSEVTAVKNLKYIDYTNLSIVNKSSVNNLYMDETPENHFYLWSSSGNYEMENLNEMLAHYDLPMSQARVFPGNNHEVFSVDTDGNISLFRDFKLVKRNFLNVGSRFVNAILIDEDGLVWVSLFDKGVYCYQGQKQLLYLNIEAPQNFVLDSENNIWTGSNKGIYKINRDIVRYTFLGTENFNGEGITGFANSSSEGLWATNGESIYFINGSDIYRSKNLFEESELATLYYLKDNSLLAHGRMTRLYTYEDPDFNKQEKTVEFKKRRRSNFVVKKSAIDKTEKVFYSFSYDYIIRLNLQNDSSAHWEFDDGRINNFFIDNSNQLVVNAASNFLVDKNGKVTPVNIYNQFNGRYITSHIILDKESEIFNLIGNDMYIQHQGKFYDVLGDLRNQVDFRIRDMVYYDKTLFFFTEKTIYFINNPLQAIKGIQIELNRLNNEFHNINDIFVNDDKLFVGSDDGMTIIPVKECVNATYQPIKPYFAKVLLDDEEVDITKGAVSFKNKNRLNIEFSSFNFSSIPSNYAYMLEGVNKSWITGTETQVVYLNLEPGNYIFKLKSRKNMEEYSDTIELPVKVIPTLWQRLITKIVVALLVLLIGFLIIREYYRQQIKAREKDYQLATIEHRALQSMMNPHFIFNSLGSIQKFLLENKPEEAGSYLSRFARLIRQTMNSIKSNSVLLDEEIERLRNYIELEQFRLDQKFDYSIELDERLESDDYNIPSMIIQPFVENAIWHGISPLPGKGIIKIIFEYVGEKSIRILVEDNGIGFTKTRAFAQSKNSLNISSSLTKKRIKLLGDKYKIDAEIMEEELYPGEENPGARIILVLPIID
ncbi:MAG: histidine kinase [Draconibacterium sp.]